MVRINKSSIESFMGPVRGKVSLFLVSKKSPRLKKLNLENLSAAKLKLYGQEHRFILVIEKGDIVFAHAHAKHAEQLEKAEGLSLDGREVIIKALSDEDAEQVTAIGEAFEDHVLNHIEKKEGEIEEEVRQAPSQSAPRRQYLAKNRLISDEVHTHFIIEQMVKRNLGRLISDCMKRFQEAREEWKKQQEADNKFDNIKKSEIKKEIARAEIKTEEVKQQEQRHRIIAEDVKRTNRTRGA